MFSLRYFRISHHMIGSAASFFLISLCSLGYFLQDHPGALKQVGPIFIWVMAIFSALLSTASLIEDDFKEGLVEQEILSGVSLGGWIFRKVMMQFLSYGWMLLLIVYIISYIFSLEIKTTYKLLFTLSVGFPALSLGCIFAGLLTLDADNQGLLLGIIMLPLCLPLLLFALGVIENPQCFGLQNGPFLLFIGNVCIMISLFFLGATYALKCALEETDA